MSTKINWKEEFDFALTKHQLINDAWHASFSLLACILIYSVAGIHWSLTFVTVWAIAASVELYQDRRKILLGKATEIQFVDGAIDFLSWIIPAMIYLRIF